MSKRAKDEASRRLGIALFGHNCTREDIMGSVPQPSAREKLLRHAKTLRDLANRGMCVRKYNRLADEAEAQAALLPQGEV